MEDAPEPLRSPAPGNRHNARMRTDPAALRAQVERDIRRHDLIPPGGDVLCLVSGGADSTCLLHVLGALGYATRPSTSTTASEAPSPTPTRASAARRLGAEVVDGARRNARRTELRDASATPSRPSASGRPGTPPPIRSRPSSSEAPRERRRRRDQAPPRGRRRAPAARPLARGDRGLLPRPRASPTATTPRTPTRSAA